MVYSVTVTSSASSVSVHEIIRESVVMDEATFTDIMGSESDKNNQNAEHYGSKSKQYILGCHGTLDVNLYMCNLG